VQLAHKYLGRDPRAPSPQDFADVENVLVKIRPYIRNIDTSGEINAIANGDICISLGYSGDFVQANKRAKEAKNGIELDYFIPEEGSSVGLDLAPLLEYGRGSGPDSNKRLLNPGTARWLQRG
jgi:putrescine transport system substrate-binding protein